MRITRRGFLIGAGVAGGGLLLGTVGLATYVAAYDQRGMQRTVLGGDSPPDSGVRAEQIALFVIYLLDGFGGFFVIDAMNGQVVTEALMLMAK